MITEVIIILRVIIIQVNQVKNTSLNRMIVMKMITLMIVQVRNQSLNLNLVVVVALVQVLGSIIHQVAAAVEVVAHLINLHQVPSIILPLLAVLQVVAKVVARKAVAAAVTAQRAEVAVLV